MTRLPRATGSKNRVAAEVRHYGPGGREHGGGIGRFIGYVVDAAAARGARHRVTDTRGPVWSKLRSPWRLAGALARMAQDRVIAPERLHHIHVAGRGSTLRKLVLAGLARRLGCRHVLHLHDYDYAGDFALRSKRGKAAVRAMFSGADAVVVLGRKDRDFVTGTLGVDPARVAVLHNCVPDPGPRATFPEGDPQILFLGTLGPRKGVPELIAALSTPEMRGLAWRAVLAGDGDAATYRRQAEAGGIAGRLSFPGWLDTAATAALRAESHVFVLPSHAEGLSMALLEAMASELAVIATPVGAHAEILTDGETALFVPPGDTAALAKALARLVGDPGLRAAIAASGRAAFERRHAIAAYMDALAAVYARASAPATGPRPAGARSGEVGQT